MVHLLGCAITKKKLIKLKELRQYKANENKSQKSQRPSQDPWVVTCFHTAICERLNNSFFLGRALCLYMERTANRPSQCRRSCETWYSNFKVHDSHLETASVQGSSAWAHVDPGQVIPCGGRSCALLDAEQHSWPLPTRCQEHPLP